MIDEALLEPGGLEVQLEIGEIGEIGECLGHVRSCEVMRLM